MTVRILTGDCRDVLAGLPAESVHCCVTSPPYWGLRDYGIGKDAHGLEPTIELYCRNAVEIFRAVHRVLRPDGTCWINLGDSYATGTGKERKPTQCGKHGYWENPNIAHRINGAESNLKPKDLCGIPWRVAFALQADGWWLRQDIIWAKPNPMPESVTDRCTKAHEYLFLLSKSAKYYFDAEAIKEGVACDEETQRTKNKTRNEQRGKGDQNGTYHARGDAAPFNNWSPVRNKRSVWTVATSPFPEAHFATFPPALIEPCIKAGCPLLGTVLDPFFGAGTTGLVADRLQRNCIGIELNPNYASMAHRRLSADAPLLAQVEAAE